MSAETQVNPIINLMPFLLITLLWVIFFCRIAERKGQNIWLSFILLVVPILGFFWGLYLCSLTDNKIKQDIEELKKAAKI